MGQNQGVCGKLQLPVRVFPVLHPPEAPELVYSVRSHAGQQAHYPFWFEFQDLEGNESLCRLLSKGLGALLHSGGQGELPEATEHVYARLAEKFTGERPKKMQLAPSFAVATFGEEVTPELEKQLAASLVRGIAVLDLEVKRHEPPPGTDVFLHLAMPQLLVSSMLMGVKSLSDASSLTSKFMMGKDVARPLFKNIKLAKTFKESFTLQLGPSDALRDASVPSAGDTAVDAPDERLKSALVAHGLNFSGLPLDIALLRTWAERGISMLKAKPGASELLMTPGTPV